ncbi:MAG: hypothetical protein FWG05_05945 [Kiritimatiellaeota bacterium]|nr:hypothetical protein [Kiritimatiellota bacterium]
MKISTLDVFVTAQEAAARAKELLAKVPELKDCEVELRDNGVALRRSVGPLALELVWRVSLVAPNEVVAELSQVAPSLMGGGMMADALMKEIAKKLNGVPGLRVEGREIFADAAVFLRARLGVELAGALRELAVTREGVSIRMEGAQQP